MAEFPMRKKTAEGVVNEGLKEGNSLTEIIDALEALASDENADPGERSVATRMLEAYSKDPDARPATRGSAAGALWRINRRAQCTLVTAGMNRHTHASPGRAGHVGRFPAMTPEDARSFLSKRAAR